MGRTSASTTAKQTAFGALLRQYRLAVMLSQEALAERAGLSADAIGVIEREKRGTPRPETVALLVRALGLDDKERAAFVAAAQAVSRSAVVHELSASRGQGGEKLPPFQSVLATHALNLPPQPTPFVGREREVKELEQLLSREDVHLLTLSGSGGIGKTRLAVEVAGRFRELFPDGVCFISLESVTEAEAVPSTVAACLGIKEPREESLADTLIRSLQNKKLLLIFDTFEHLLDAALFVGDLLSSCAQLTVLVTSQAFLHLAAEHVYEVPPLSLPGPNEGLDAKALLQSDAISLFVGRAEAVGLGFELTKGNAPVIADICARLDGLPLAIELAAARTRLFSPSALLGRLQSRLALLTGGPRDFPRRHQTLRDTIDWSYRLLDEPQQRLFARLSVFVGGFTLETVEAVCGDGDATASNVLEQLASLADKSLIRIQREGDEPRFAMLDTIREYALERLERDEDAESVRRRHALAFLSYARHAAQQITGSQPDIWLTRLDTEFGNLRAALHWVWRRGATDIGLGLTTSLTPFWLERGYASEGLTWLDRFLEDFAHGKPDPSTSDEDQIERRKLYAAARELAANLANRVGNSERACEDAAAAVDLYTALGKEVNAALCLRTLAEAEQHRGNIPTALAHYRESYALHKELGHDWEAAHVWNEMRIATEPDSNPDTRAKLEENWNLLCEIMSTLPATDPYYPVSLGQYAFHLQLYEQACQLLESGRVIAQTAGNKQQLGIALNMLGEISLLRGDLEEAAEYLDASEPMRRDTEDARGLMFTLRNRAKVAFFQGDFPGARGRYEESLGLLTKTEDYRGVTDVLRNLGDVARAEGDLDRAADRYRESLGRAVELDDPERIAAALRGLAGVCCLRGEHERAARLFGAANTSDEDAPLTSLIDHARDIEGVRDALGEAEFERTWLMAQDISLQEAIDEWA